MISIISLLLNRTGRSFDVIKIKGYFILLRITWLYNLCHKVLNKVDSFLFIYLFSRKRMLVMFYSVDFINRFILDNSVKHIIDVYEKVESRYLGYLTKSLFSVKF